MDKKFDSNVWERDFLNPVSNVWERDFLNPVNNIWERDNSITRNKGASREQIVPSLIEPFDGIRKTNARQIFGILLIIIVLDFAMDIIV
jgi:hypothetical protein